MQVITKNELLLKKELLLTGVIASVVYILLFIFGGLVVSSVSLTSNQANSSAEMTILAVVLVYNLLMMLFGLTLFAQFSDKRNLTKMKVTGLLFLVLGVLGILLLIFPAKFQFDFSINTLLILLQWCITIAVVLISGLALTQLYEMSGYLFLSIMVVAIVVLTLAIGLFLVWVGLISYVLYKKES